MIDGTVVVIMFSLLGLAIIGLFIYVLVLPTLIKQAQKES